MQTNPNLVPSNGRKRPDISVWYKASDNLLAAIEIKRAWNLGPIYSDAQKIQKYLADTDSAKIGYILAYSDIDKSKHQGLDKRFSSWVKALGKYWSLAGSYIDEAANDPKDIWGYALLRYDRGQSRGFA